MTVQLSVAIPCYNEEAVLPLLEQRLVPALNAMGVTWEVVFVNDGSSDRTIEILREMADRNPRFKVLSFSRNFGHQAALFAAIHEATGDMVALMDADLQDPPELLANCVEHWRQGYEVIYAIRTKRKENAFKRFCYATAYRIINALADIDIPLDSGDFCLMDRQVVNAMKQMPERNVFLRGMRAWSGFRQVGIEYERDARAAGETKYPFRQLVRLALNGIFGFSTVPLRIATWLGLTTMCFALFCSAFVVAWRFMDFRIVGMSARDVPGWTGVIVALSFFTGVQMLLLGIFGEYIARMYEEVKQRPRWIVHERRNTQ